MKMWSVGTNSDELVIEPIEAGAVHGDLFLEFHCQWCEEFHSAKCTCAAKAETVRDFFCSCVPEDCPSCGQQMVSASDSLLLESAV